MSFFAQSLAAGMPCWSSGCRCEDGLGRYLRRANSHPGPEERRATSMKAGPLQHSRAGHMCKLYRRIEAAAVGGASCAREPARAESRGRTLSGWTQGTGGGVSFQAGGWSWLPFSIFIFIAQLLAPHCDVLMTSRTRTDQIILKGFR